MQATVLRNGSSQGHLFIEVEADGVRYAVPVTQELPVNTIVDITVKVAEVPPAPESELPGTDVSTAAAPVAVVPESPLAKKPTKKGSK